MAVRLTVEIDEDLKRRAKAQAYAEGSNLKDKVIELLEDWLKKKKR